MPRKSRTHRTRFIIVCRFADGSIKYPTGHGSNAEGQTIMLFSKNIEEALSSHIADALCSGWPYLLKRHMHNTGERFAATVCQAHETPRFAECPA